MRRLTRNLPQNLIYAIIWLVVFILPVAVYYQSGAVSWSSVSMFWMHMAPFLVLFLINDLVLIPRLLLRGRWVWYGATLAAAIIVLFYVLHPAIVHNHFFDSIVGGGPGRMPPPPGRPPMHHGKPPGRMPMMLNEGLMAILVAGFNVAIRYLFKSMRDERQIRELEAHHLQSELNYLKAQINPHFFMNTLNNIHALVDIDAEKAKQSVIELSKIMRYVLYEADKPGIELAREIAFIENYVSLMRIRYSDEIDIRMDFPDPVPEVMVPPMLLVTLIENAFKHGISYRRKSFIHSTLTLEEGSVVYRVDNSMGKAESGKPRGVGMENMKKRLGLLFGTGGYRLDVEQAADKYSVVLEIPLSQ